MNNRLSIQKIVIGTVLASFYFLAGKLGLSLAFVNSSATAVWPPTGIAFAALLIFGYRVWPWIFIGAFLVNMTTAGTVASSLGIAVGNTLEALVGTALVNRYANGQNLFDRPQDIFKFVVLAGLLSTMISPTVGVTVLELSGLAKWVNFKFIWLTWWIGDAVGCMLVAPLLILWSVKKHPRWKREKIIEGLFLLLSLFLISLPILDGLWPYAVKNYPLEFLCLPILIWAVFRFGPQEATTVMCFISSIAIWGTLHGIGPFVRDTPNESLLLLQIFMGFISVMTAALASSVEEKSQIEKALRGARDDMEIRVLERTGTLSNALKSLLVEMAEHQQSEKALKQSEKRYRNLIESARDIIYTISIDGTILSLNPSFEVVTGWTCEEWIGKKFNSLPHPEDLPSVMQRFEGLLQGQPPSKLEWRAVAKSGEVRIVESTMIPELEKGKVVRMLGIARDITDRKQAEEERLKLIQEQAARLQAEISQERATFLSEASALIFASLDYESVPSTIARLVVLKIADWCAVYLTKEDGSIGRIEAAHANPDKVELIKQLTQIKPSQKDTNHPVIKALRTGKSESVPEVSSSQLKIMTSHPDQERLLGELGLQSYLCIPMYSRGRMLGALLLAKGEKGQPYNSEDLDLAEELARRAGFSIDNAKLYMETLQAKEAMRESESWKGAILTASLDSIITVDESGKIIGFNPAAEIIFGFSRRHVMGGVLVDLIIPPSSRETYRKAMENFVETGDDLMLGKRIEITAMRSDGSEFPAEMAMASIPLKGRPGFTVYLRDITERQKFEKELGHARDLAVESARLKSEFVAHVSHEIRTPMNGIIGMISLLMNTELSPKQRDFIETVSRSCDNLLSIINDILDFSKIESGVIALEKQPFDLKAVINDTINFLKPRAHSKNLKITSVITEDVSLALQGDPTRVRQILTNLIGNAVKFTEHGSVTIEVSSKNESDTHTTLQLSVIDTGIGVPAEQQEQLFQPFTQADQSITQKYGGTGLGLAISKRLVEAMGGEIGFKSQLGIGSVFWCVLTFEKQHEDSLREPEKTPPEPRRNGGTAKPVKSKLMGTRPNKYKNGKTHPHVLVAEDNSINQKVMVHLLEELGCTADAVGNGLEALEASKRIPYNMVLMDCQMPDMDGFSATTEIRKREEPGRHLPIVAMTAHAMRGDREKCLAAGMDDYLSKPINTEELATVLSKWIAPQGQARQTKIKLPAGLNNPSFLREVTRLFLKQAPVHLAAIKKSFTNGDKKSLAAAAHTLRGVCANLGLQQMLPLCHHIEEWARSENSTNGIESKISQLTQCYEQLEGTLKTKAKNSRKSRRRNENSHSRR